MDLRSTSSTNRCSDIPLDEVATQELQSALEQLAKKNLPDEAKAFFLAELYIQYGQNSKAAAQLESLIRAQSQFEGVHERRAAVEMKLQEVRSNSETNEEKLSNLLDEIKMLHSYDPCGKHGCDPDQRAVWSRTLRKWVCVGC